MTDPVDPNEPAAYPDLPYVPPSVPSPWHEPIAQPPVAPPAYTPPPSTQPPPYETQSHYGMQAYPQPAPTQASWEPAWEPYVPTRRRRRALPVIAVIALLVAGAVVWDTVVANRHSSADRIAAPAQLGGYQLVQGAAAQRMTSLMRSAMSADHQFSSLMSRATIAEYARDSGDQPRLILLAFRTRDVAGTGSPVDALAAQIGAVAGPTAMVSIPPGAHGGTIGCGTITIGVHAEIACSWTDAYSTGILEAIDPSQTASQFGQTVVALQDLIDH